MKNILLGTKNEGKIKEFNELLSTIISHINVLGLKDVKEKINVIEDKPNFYENALKKAQEYALYYKMPTIAEDSGLVVPALNNEPGIYSARYAGESATDEDNINLLLKNMININHREAYFESTLVFYLNEKKILSATGRCYGTISNKRVGYNGFGYDPIFFLPEKNKTLAQLTLKEKNNISHRKIAFKKLLDKLVKEKIFELI